jgi:hypothetical protein
VAGAALRVGVLRRWRRAPAPTRCCRSRPWFVAWDLAAIMPPGHWDFDPGASTTGIVLPFGLPV